MPYKDRERQLEAQRQHYRDNKDSFQTRQTEWRAVRRRELAKYVQNIKSNQPCVDCGLGYPYYVMDFDHLEGKGGKKNAVCRLVNRPVSLDRLKAEIAKCELVCSNCHRIRTHDRTHQVVGHLSR